MALYVQKIVDSARIPSLQPEGSYIIYAPAEVIVPTKGNVIVPVGIYLIAPVGHVVQAMSGPESLSNGIELGSYCSFNCPNPHFFKNAPSPQELRVKVYNHGEIDHKIIAGSPIGQIVVRQICPFQVVETEQIHEMIANPPKIPSAMIRKKRLPKQAAGYFKQLYAEDYKTVRAKYLNEANLLKIEEYKKNPNYLSSPNRQNLEAAFAWGLLDRTVQDQIRAELVVLNEQEARVDQMAGTRLKDDDAKTEKSGKKGKKAEPAEDDSGEAEPNDTDENVEEVDADPDAENPGEAKPEAIQDIEDLNEEAVDEEEEEDAEEEDEEEEEPATPAKPAAAKPAAPVAPVVAVPIVAKPAAPVAVPVVPAVAVPAVPKAGKAKAKPAAR